MSSATVREMDAVHKAISAVAPRVMSKGAAAKIQMMGLSPRQQHLDWLWKWYCTENYDECRVDWQGMQVMDQVETSAIIREGFIPDGFYDVGQTFPIKFRRPSAPSGMAKLIVDRFTGLLFSDRTHPRVIVPGDPDTEDYIQALIESADLWSAMMEARNFGGATGSVAVGFKFVNGELRIEVHDPRWLRMTFAPGGFNKLLVLEIRYIYFQEDWDPDTKEWVTTPLWYRRVIDETSDTLFHPEYAKDGEEPKWEEAEVVAHGFGFCPVVWIQNTRITTEVDGLPDAHGCYDKIHQYDQVTSQAHVAVLSNCDPTLVVATNLEIEDEVQKGSNAPLKVDAGGSVKYLELAGTSVEIAMKLGDKDRKDVCDLAQVVLPGDETGSGQMTATEIERKHGPMYARADALRQQYGKCGVRLLLDMVLQAIRTMNKGRTLEDGTTEKQAVRLPPKVVKDEKTGETTFEPRRLGHDNAQIMLKWPRYYPPSLEEMDLAVRSAAGAKLGKLIDREHATTSVAEYFAVDDVPAMLERITKEAKEEAQEMEDMMMAGRPGGGGGGGLGNTLPVPGKKLMTP